MQQSRLGDGRHGLDRRAFCRAAGVVTAVGVVGAKPGKRVGPCRPHQGAA
jgi:hypothetical protein